MQRYFLFFLPDICLPKNSDGRPSTSAETECKSGGISNQKRSNYLFTANPTATALHPTGFCSRGSHEFNITGSVVQQWAARFALLEVVFDRREEGVIGSRWLWIVEMLGQPQLQPGSL